MQNSTSNDQQRNTLGDGYQAQTFIGTYDDSKAIIKKIYHPSIPLLRDLEWWMLKREAEVLERLCSVDAVPDLLGCQEKCSIAIEFIDGQTMREINLENVGADFYNELENIVHEIHSHGIVHSDLKKKENILVTPDHKPVVIDFGASFKLDSKLKPFSNFIYKQFYHMDLNAVSKHKRRQCQEAYTERDQQRLDNPVVLEKLDRFRRDYLFG